MNVTELARQLRINTKQMLEILPAHGFDIGAKAVKIDDRVANQIMRQWKYIKKAIEDKEKKAKAEQLLKEKEMRKQVGESVALPSLITVRDFASRLNLPVTQLITELMKNGILANQNQNIDYDTAAIMAEELGFTVLKETGDRMVEDDNSHVLENALQKGENKTRRAPVVVVMGHVDHGKTKLLDSIRQTNIVDTESGGITQHIGAYQTIWKDPKTKEERPMTFIDTPGHEAFTVMRSRGAKIADLAILVVAADDSVKPQTEEVIQIIKAAKLPFVVAINKIDKETADIQRVKTELSQRDVLAEEWGGSVPMVEISAKEKLNIDKLLDVLLLVSDMNADSMQADTSIPAVGTVIESHVDKGTGPVTTILVQAGTLKKGDPLVLNGEIYGKVRAMHDYKGEEILEAGPSVPVQIIGFKVAPEVGDIMDVGLAKGAQKIDAKQKYSQQTGAENRSAFQSNESEEDGKNKKYLNIVIKADVLGSLEAIIGALENIQHEEVRVKIIGKGLGNINENDIAKVESSGGAILAFKVGATPMAGESIRDKKIQFLKFDIIYDLIDWAKDELEKMLEKELVTTEIGNLKVLAIFRTDKGAMTLGGRVEIGKVIKDALVRIKREKEIVGIGKVSKLQTGQSETKQVPQGSECGLRIESKTKIEAGDILEFYTEELVVRKMNLKK
ncbi:MAG: translation initiation factor IF-2 [Candidatus Magasanikbacteria bacterium RIFCSPHIGHO2_01_FULL_33_34]|uniref:Translation initiation factor IF-2 n=1 Tax=Candidatus Magasanikbacteria bacterium RIFCSPHIGHO2_01_FULL_33_34 TaxID=1798671 RepID=A0A1F6LHL4_9BACT|nr:MAG: translation initiation factor IF-2 [Candidatus Magasanikbacteria bacterium RIFCSPHIGHO2_01_FULL_33_34]OGH65052.1 MAG: translation initiation factor IF-2 [Candidatus Magasanikbacteria bacterium RIFCSPHIGHO2_02_FULL_33_17]OGH75404.1 MAG: translation initiation factor IF-2 [Candidatus Magasanikbacteria bacterium RIFCSPLOWO2_01_FULL_33_34]OGH81463.1 MAG: translation initiation factor IF-2 [Candidatus Magasanikbacteria bacterium RIFCSPLOWO2_12_FULL_34_7]